MSSSESEEVGIKNGDLFVKQKAEQTKKAKSKKDKKADDKSKAAKDLTEEEINSLIELLENKSFLWDIYHKEYKKRDLKEIALFRNSYCLRHHDSISKNKNKQLKNKSLKRGQ